MIFLLNNERVFVEIFNLAKLKLARELRVDPEIVSVSVVIDEGKIVPTFSLPDTITPEKTTEEIQVATGAVWSEVKEELAVRLRGLSERRYG